MATLARELRKELKKTVTEACVEAEAGARKALEEYAVHEAEPYSFMDHQRQQRRERLRARGLQAGDIRDENGSQSIQHLCAEFAYEHWHRMLFARFLAENNLLIPPGQEPGKEIAISLEECRQMAREESRDWITMASEYAQRMLPAIFRSDDPVLDLSLPPESHNQLEKWLKDLPTEIFLADDSFGWVYQFWQAKKKDEINDSGVKIGADEIAPVTQLFTEDYMVLFLLHNTLGAWWAAKRRAKGKPHELPGYDWTYLRFKEDGMPAAGRFEGWPALARDLKVLDPCMGSGHFLVFALPILVGFRMAEEGMSRREALTAVLHDNLYGVEIDPRCTQIAAFNLALTAWKMNGGHFQLPQLNLACSGLGINAKEEDWVTLAGKDPLLCETMKELYQLFKQAPLLGSLIDPRQVGGHLFAANFEKARPLLEQALGTEHTDALEAELAVTAKGMVSAVQILQESFALVATNVPYLGRGKQDDVLKKYCETFHPHAKADLAACFIERCLRYCCPAGTAALVSPQNWFFLPGYMGIRKQLLQDIQFNIIARLGANAFQDMNFWAATTAMTIITCISPNPIHFFAGLDASSSKIQSAKMAMLRGEMHGTMREVQQSYQLSNPDARISMDAPSLHLALRDVVITPQGLKTGDDPRSRRTFWEVNVTDPRWRFLHGAPDRMRFVDGACFVIDFSQGESGFARPQGQAAWGKLGFIVKLMGEITVARYFGEVFDSNVTAVVPRDQQDFPAIWTYLTSPDFASNLHSIEQSVKINNATVGKVPFSPADWRQKAQSIYAKGLPKPHTNDSTQWLFNGYPCGSEQALQVAVARLLGYRWPRQTGSNFLDCPVLGKDGLEPLAVDDGIISLSALQDSSSAADQLNSVLAAAYGKEWPAVQPGLLKQAGAKSSTLEDWLRDEFFAHHCDVFHNRPFIWHISDGLDQGFHALVNYHKLAEGNGGGRRTLEKLTYTYLGDWIERQRNQQKQGIAGSDARVASAIYLQDELKKILAGEKPYDIFVRWKPMHEQSIGWEPDINDGVRINIRPFIIAHPLTGKGKNACILRVRPGSSLNWKKDRGIEPMREKQDYPWFWTWDESTGDFDGGEKFDGNRWNDLHYSIEKKRASTTNPQLKKANTREHRYPEKTRHTG